VLQVESGGKSYRITRNYNGDKEKQCGKKSKYAVECPWASFSEHAKGEVQMFNVLG